MLHHVAVVVKDLDDAVNCIKGLLDVKEVSRKSYGDTNVVMLDAGNTLIEVIQPTSSETSYGRFLLGIEGGIHHLAFRHENQAELIAKLTKLGFSYDVREGRDYTLIDVDSRHTHSIRIQFFISKER